MRILIVDDDLEQLRLLGLAFRARGHEVVEVDKGLGVIDRLDGRVGVPPDVCILDNYMPAISGVAILRLASRTRVADAVTIVVYSSDPNVEAAVADVGHPHGHFALKTGRVLGLVQFVEDLMREPSRPL